MEECSQYLVESVMMGTAEKILQGIRKYLEIGVRQFVLYFIGLDDAILRLFDSKVIIRISKYYHSSSGNRVRIKKNILPKRCVLCSRY